MGKGEKYLVKKKKGFLRPTTKKKRKMIKEKEMNKKTFYYNRYKNKKKIEEELAKKRQFEQKLQQEQLEYSESEEEEDPYELLVSCFRGKNKRKQVVESDESDASETFDHEDIKNDVDMSSEHGDTMNENNYLEEKVQPKQNNSHMDDESSEESEVPENNLDSEYDDKNIPNDTFTKHLQYDIGEELLASVSNSPPTVEQSIETWPVLGTLSIVIPKPVETKKTKPKFSILEEVINAEPGAVPQVNNKVDFKELNIKSQIHGNIVSANKANLIKRDSELSDIFTPLQKELFAIINNYQDLCYPERTFSNAEEIRYIYCLHAINHMLKTRIKILHHNAKLSKKKDLSDEYRDQGLVRPKVLIMVPFKHSAYRVVKTLIDILVPKEAGQVVNRNKFEEDFTGGELAMPKKNPKPEDYELLFSGNTDDTFRLGMSLTKKTLKLYTDFYSSDIIVTSPLGLRMIVGAEGEEERDYDFLASIELLIMDQADVFLMQNWHHLLNVLDHFHLQPKKTHDTDFSRVRTWAANGWSKYYRQTLIFSSILMAEIRSIFNRKCHNYAGKVLVTNAIEVGTIQEVILQVPQMFYRFNATSPVAAVDARFEYFIKEILPKHRDIMMSHTLIYVPSYFDYVRIRNYFKKEDIGFVQICEYSKDAKIARARDMFFHTEAHFLLYSERMHFFRRLRIKGIRHIIFYQPPTYPHFYSELCNLMLKSNQNKYGGSECIMSVTTLYCKYDIHQMLGVLGTKRAVSMMQSDKPVYNYVIAKR